MGIANMSFCAVYIKSSEANGWKIGVCKNDGVLKIVVTSTFEEIVLDESKDVMLAVLA